MKKRVIQVLIMLCIPFFIGMVIREDEQIGMLEKKVSDAGFRVIVSDATGNYTYDPEELIPYMVAAIVPFGTEEQLLQALAIVCRTNLLFYWEENGRQDVLTYEECGLPICSFFEYKELLAYKMKNTEDKEDDIRRAVEATEGIILLCEGEVIKAPFFYLSAGKTRDGSAQEDYKYLQSKACEEDIYHSSYLKKYYFEKEEFWLNIEMLLKESVSQEMIDRVSRTVEDWGYRKDTAGYVCALIHKKEQLYIDGVSFCEKFDLCSSYFEIEERESQIVITTKGVGHGFGLNLTHATSQAQAGMSSYDILSYYFTNTKVDKGYNVSVE